MLLHTLTGIHLFVFLGGKIVLHYRLNKLHGKNLGWRSFDFTPIDYFLLYVLKVEKEYGELKKNCNCLLWATGGALVGNFLLV